MGIPYAIMLKVIAYGYYYYGYYNYNA